MAKPIPDGKLMHAEVKLGDWGLATHEEDVSPEEMDKRKAAALAERARGQK